MAYYEIGRYGAGKFGAAYSLNGPLGEGSAFLGTVDGRQTEFTIERGKGCLNKQPVKGSVVFDLGRDFGRTRKILVDFGSSQPPTPGISSERGKFVDSLERIYRDNLEASGKEDPKASFLRQMAYIAIALIRAED